MSIGLGVFLGLVFCGVIYLYAQTKDRWNWKRARNIGLVTMGTLTALGLISIGGVVLYDYYRGLPKIITEFKQIKLGESLSDATFKLGIPKWSIEHNEKKTNSATRPVAGNVETYYFKSNSVEVTIRHGKIEHISYSCALDEPNYKSLSDYTSLNGIRCGDNGEEILSKFNKDVRVLCRIPDKQEGPWSEYERLGRVYDVVKYGTRYYLSQNSVFAIAIASTENLESDIGKEWDKCK